MKNLLACLVVALACTASAQDSPTFTLKKPVMCAEAVLVFKAMQERMDMAPLFVSGSEKGRSTTYVLMVGKNTKRWAVVESDGDTACIVAEGMKMTIPPNAPVSVD